MTREGSLELPALEEGGGEIAARSPLQLFWRRLRQDRVAMAALVFIGILVVFALAAPLIVKLFGAPLLNGVNGRNLALMLLLALAGIGSSILAIQRRDVGA